ncbi:MAG: 6-carboxytetrahydropterin synthase QueD [Caldisericaceae bacterium]|nr:6-carboxytetrahydropterin synthase QueD [Caldisericaceae bacterium]
MYQLSIDLMISASHQLRGYQGPCQRIHGHNWKVQVVIQSDTLNSIGMVIDFKDLTDLAWQVVGKFDHQMLNEIEPFNKINPTAENMSRYFFKEIARLLPSGVKMKAIRLWETPKYMVEYTE